MKNKVKYIVFIIILFLTGCSGGCFMSGACYTEKESERILSLTDEQRASEIQRCIKQNQSAIDNTPNEKKYCTFWNCHLGKEDFRKMLKLCPEYYDPASWKK